MPALTGSSSVQQYLKLAQNKLTNLALGWHVLRNRTYRERHTNRTQRDNKAKEFFADGIWYFLNPQTVAIEALKTGLNRVLQHQILTVLSDLIAEINVSIGECKMQLKEFGPAREPFKRNVSI